jgi:hypothetical protein
MCGLCGVLGVASHWTDSSGAAASRTHRHDRLVRAAQANAVLMHYGLKMDDWQGSTYLLRSQTGGTTQVDSLADLWTKAEQLSGRRCDPLDPMLLERLEGR